MSEPRSLSTKRLARSADQLGESLGPDVRVTRRPRTLQLDHVDGRRVYWHPTRRMAGLVMPDGAPVALVPMTQEDLVLYFTAVAIVPTPAPRARARTRRR